MTFSIGDASPIAGAKPVVQLDDDALAGGDAGGTGDDVDAANLVGTLSGEGGDVPANLGLRADRSAGGVQLRLGRGRGRARPARRHTVLTITLNSASGAYTVTQNAPIVHAAGGDENEQGFILAYTVDRRRRRQCRGTLAIRGRRRHAGGDRLDDPAAC